MRHVLMVALFVLLLSVVACNPAAGTTEIPTPTDTPTATPTAEPTPTETVTPSPTPTPVSNPTPTPVDESARPDDVELRNLAVTPSEALVGETVSISLEVVHLGIGDCTYEVVLLINGVEKDRQEVTVGPARFKTVEFDDWQSSKAGVFTVSVDELRADFEVFDEEPFRDELVLKSVNAMYLDDRKTYCEFGGMITNKNKKWAITNVRMVVYTGSYATEVKVADEILPGERVIFNREKVAITGDRYNWKITYDKRYVGSTVVADESGLGVELVYITPKITNDKLVEIVIRTEPGATVFLQPINPVTGTRSADPSGKIKVADTEGRASWSWTLFKHVYWGDSRLEFMVTTSTDPEYIAQWNFGMSRLDMETFAKRADTVLVEKPWTVAGY